MARQGAHRFVRGFAICALVIAVALVVAACGSSADHSGSGGGGGSTSSGGSASGISYGTLPAKGAQSKGGTITVGQLTGSTPTYIFPIIPGTAATAYTINLIQNVFAPLYNGPRGAKPTIDYRSSIGNKPTFANGGKTVTITLKPGYKWSNGQPVDANDMVFEIALLKAAVKESAANWSQYTPGQFPTSVVSATAPSKYKLVMKLNKAYNPNYFLNNQVQDTNNVYPLPSTDWNIDRVGGPHLDYTNPANAKRIYDFLSAQGKTVSRFATSPLWRDSDGPYRLQSFSATNSSFTMAPNPTYPGPGPYASVQVNTYTSDTAQLNALESGSLDIGEIFSSQIGAVPQLRSDGYSVFGGPAFGWQGAVINFKDTTGHFDKIIAQEYVRQAIAHLINQPAYVKGIFKNAAAPNYGPVPGVPINPFTPDNNKSADGPYPYDPSMAASILKAHGWKVVPNGQTTCERAGSGAGECGAGIPAGTPLKFNWVDDPESQVPSSALEGQALASEAKATAGINLTLETKTFNFQIANYDDADPSDVKNENSWAVANYGGFFYDYYPASEGVFNTGGVFNAGAYSEPEADKLMKASVFSADPDAVTAEAKYLTANFPVFFMPQNDYIWAVSKHVGGNPADFGSLTQNTLLPAFWWVNR
jgi:peptide/nickel transport system substrate-binding protein